MPNLSLLFFWCAAAAWSYPNTFLTERPNDRALTELGGRWIQTNASVGGLSRHQPFLRWYFSYLREAVNASSGLWCTEQQIAKRGVLNCIGGSFHIDFVMQNVVLHPEHAPPGTDASWAHPAAVLRNSLALQQGTGGWTPDGMAYLNVDGIYQATRPAVQLGGAQSAAARWSDVERACDRLMGLVTTALNNRARIMGQISHNLPALVGAVAECAKQFPSMIRSKRPWQERDPALTKSGSPIVSPVTWLSVSSSTASCAAPS